MKNTVELRDLIGQPIVPGAIIAYGIRNGCSGDLRIGKVIKAGLKRKYEWQDHDDDLVARITVRSIEKDWEGKLVLLKKAGTIQYPERCVVLDTSKIDPAVLAMFEAVPVQAVL